LSLKELDAKAKFSSKGRKVILLLQTKT